MRKNFQQNKLMIDHGIAASITTLQSHDWNNGTNGGCQLGDGDLRLLPLPLWPTNKAWTIGVVTYWGHSCSKNAPPVPATHPTHLLCKFYADTKKEWQNTMKFMQPSVI